ncbi:MAG: enoyl-CoA hydratase-related protein [Nitrososphaerales archaeon]
MLSKDYKNVLIDQDENGITTITFNRPDKKNALNPDLHNEMLNIMNELEFDDSTRVVILTGAGDSFCAGQDLKEFFLNNVANPKDRIRTSGISRSWGKKLRTLPKPTIAQVNGWCFGAGLRIMGLCDFAISSDKAVYGLSEINFAHFPSAGAMWVPAHLLLPRDAIYLAMTGEKIDAAVAERMRLVTKTVPHEKLREEVLNLANILRLKDPIALRACKETYRLTMRLDYDDSIEWEYAKGEEKTYLQKGLWVDALSDFDKKKFRPGLETFKSEEQS